MRYKGFNFNKTTRVVPLPKKYWTGKHKNYVVFGQVVVRWDKIPSSAVETEYTWDFHGEAVPTLAVPIKGHNPNPDGTSHSRTNMMYAANGRVYLFHDGQVYMAWWHKKEGSQ
jgi:hypothetical protein